MPEVLSQNEVDALLSAVDEVDLDLSAGEEKASIGEMSIYDFKRPERVSKDQIRALEGLHEVLARNLGATLSGTLRTIVDVKLTTVEQLTYGEFVMSLPNPTCFNVMTVEPLEGNMILEINPSIVFPIIDKLLGGGAFESIVPDREFTDIELRLIARITDHVLRHLKDVWSATKQIDFVIAETESNPQLMPIVPPNEVVVLISFEIRMGDGSGMMNLCIPFPVIEPVMGAFSSIQGWFTARQRREDQADHRLSIENRLRCTQLGARAYLAGTQISLRDLLDLKPGDVLRTEKLATAPLSMHVGGKPKFLGRVGSYRNRRAFQILKDASPEDRL